MKKIVYIADIAQDIDDVIAAEFLFQSGILNCIVLDGKSRDTEREEKLKALGVEFSENIPKGTEIVFCGGSLTKVAEYIKHHTLEILVMNGGYAGSDIVSSEHELDKFKGKTMIRTYNFNLDVEAAVSVINSPYISRIVLVSKNVCHSILNTEGNIHKDEFLKEYNLNPEKRLHDLLMAKEGLSVLKGEKTLCVYNKVKPVCEIRKPENFSVWGSVLDEDSHISISVNFI